MAECVAIIQARMTSTRLPGKVLLDICGQPMLRRVVERVQRAPGVDAVWVATTDDGTEAPIIKLCDALGVPYHRGSTDDVLGRYHATAMRAGAEIIVRITSDCPLIDPGTVGRCVAAYRAGDADYVSNCQHRTFPRGLDAEVFSFAALECAHREATEATDREHVTPFIWRQPQRFRRHDVVDPVDRSELRWTVDTEADLELMRTVFAAMKREGPSSYADVLALFEDNPAWREINAHVSQKAVGRQSTQ